MKVELLSPVGSMKTLYQAIHNGADAVYLGGKRFGARKYSDNFNEDELKEAVRYAHLFNVKVYVTANTIIYEDEINDFLEYIFFLHKINVDAVIMQDIGMIKIVRDKFPNLEVHASTQCHNQNDEGIKLLESLGVTRIVLDREMPLEEIKQLKTPLEKEVFVYGALCVSYSGCCLFSSLNGGRSGNRGECVQSCRMQYDLYENDKKIDTQGNYLLSTKDLNTLNNLKDILDTDIVSLKIEGRMKSPEYVGYVTKLYRNLIDNYYNHKKMIITREEEDNLKLLFNREFTKGYLFNSDSIMNIKTSNHLGLPIGKVINISNNKIYIKLDRELNQEDGIRFMNSNTGMIVNMLYNEKGLLVNSIPAGNIAVVDNKIGLSFCDIVNKTISKKLMDSLNNYQERKIDIDINVLVSDNNLVVTITDEDENMVESLAYVNDAKNAPTSSEDIKKSLSKLGDTIYKLNNFNISYNQDIFIPISKLNEIRRYLLNELNEKRINKNTRKIMLNPVKDKVNIIKSDKNLHINILVRNEEQLKSAIKNNVDTIYTLDKNLYNKYREEANISYVIPRVINKYLDIKNGSVLVNELGGIEKYSKDNIVDVNYTLNVVNSKSIEFLNKFKVNNICLSLELDYDKIRLLMKNDYNVSLFVYGKAELMVMKYCPLKLNINNCSRCKSDNNKYYLCDKSNNKFRILHNNCITSIMHYKNTDLINDIKKYKELGIHTYRIDLLDENDKEIDNLIKKIKDNYYSN
mgnify:CR=1 FL=1